MLWNKNGIVKALLLSIIPSIVFIVSSIFIANIPLFVFAVIFAVTHILISIKRAKTENADEPKIKKKTIISLTAVLLSVVLAFVGTLGGLLIYQQSNFGKLKNMSALDMIEYCCSNKNTKISVALIENGEITIVFTVKTAKKQTYTIMKSVRLVKLLSVHYVQKP